MSTWQSDTPPPEIRITPFGWVLVALRGLPLVVVLLLGLAVLLVLRLPERTFRLSNRPLTSHIPQIVCKIALRLIGLRAEVAGLPMRHPGAMVANHSSWLDIFVLNAGARVFFVSKSEVAGWPGIGWLARATGTVFIRRDKREAAAQRTMFEERLTAGHRLLFFPEGTSTDGQQVAPFKSTLFAAFFAPELHDMMWIQPVSLRYNAPEGADPRHYAWWGDMEFGPHLIAILGQWRQGNVDLHYHEPLKISDAVGRKPLAAHAEQAVSSVMTKRTTYSP